MNTTSIQSSEPADTRINDATQSNRPSVGIKCSQPSGAAFCQRCGAPNPGHQCGICRHVQCVGCGQ